MGNWKKFYQIFPYENYIIGTNFLKKISSFLGISCKLFKIRNIFTSNERVVKSCNAQLNEMYNAIFALTVI